MFILSIDASTKASGWAVFEDSKLVEYGLITSSSTDLIKRIYIMRDGIAEILDNPYNKDASGKGLNIDLLSVLSKYAQQRGGYSCPDLTCYAEDTGRSEEYWREYQAWMNDGKPTGIESDEQFYELQKQTYGEILVDLD